MLLKEVPKQSASIIDFAVIEGAIRERESKSCSRNLAFANLVLEAVFGLNSDVAGTCVVDGGDDRGVDIVYIDHDSKRINFGSCKAVTSLKNAGKNFPGHEIDKLTSFLSDLIFKRDNLPETCNGSLAAKVRDIWHIFSIERYSLCLHLFSNQLTLTDDSRKRLETFLNDHDISLHEHGLFELSNGVVRLSKPRFKKTLVPSTDALQSINGSHKRALVLRVRLDHLCEFLTNGRGSFDERLIWQNVRYFLGLDKDVNTGIKETLVSGRLEEFWYLNSGLTIVCDQIISLANGYHPISMVNPQIVNGCQTASVVQSVGSDTFVDLSTGYVNVKIIETDDPNLIERIASASNTQSKILGRDLRANDHFQLQIARCLQAKNYFYARKRGEYPPTSEMKLIDAAKTGQLMLAYLCGEPTLSKTASQEIFGNLYSLAFNKNTVTPDVIIAAHECYAAIDALRRQALAWQSSVSRNSYEESWIIEGHFHLLFVVGELLRRENIPMDKGDEAVVRIDRASAIVSNYVAMHHKVASYRLFRLKQSREDLLTLIDHETGARNGYAIQLALPLDDTLGDD